MDRERLLSRAKITYFFKETFRAHSKAEYKEIFSRGLGDDGDALSGAFPWLYVRVFFTLLMLFTANVLILRLTGNPIYEPSVTFLGGVTFLIPFVVFLFELYPKRDLSLMLIFSVLVIGGTLSGGLAQLGYALIDAENKWLSAIIAGLVEEIGKIVPAIIAIEFTKQKSPYAGYLLAAAVGAGFSVIEDMGYIFCYSDEFFHSDIQAVVTVFIERGLTSFCTHVVWTGAVGWAYCRMQKPFRSVWLLFLALSVMLHILWDLPLEGWIAAVIIGTCVIAGVIENVAMIYSSHSDILEANIDINSFNDNIIAEAKQMGERMRFTNAANLTFALTCALLSVIILILCALPIGMEFQRVEFESKEQFIARIEGGFNLKADTKRRYDSDERKNVEERYIDKKLSYVVQKDVVAGFDGEYYFGYYASDYSRPAEISVELDGYSSRIFCKEYDFGGESAWVFEVSADDIISYSYNDENGTVTAVTAAEEFEGYDVLIALVATACGITAGCCVVLTAFRIKLRRVKNEVR